MVDNMTVRFNQNGVNVKDFGAVGNGVADDSAAIQACLDASIGGDFAVGRRVFFPKGKYKLGTTLYVRRQLTLVGETSGGFFTASQLLPAYNQPAIQVDFENLVDAPERRGGSSIIENFKIVYSQNSTVWQKNTVYTAGQLVVSQPGYSDLAGQSPDPKVSNIYVMECTTGGTSGSSTPNWDATTPLSNGQGPLSFAEGATISDGSVTWTVRVLAGVRIQAGTFCRNVWVENCGGNGFAVLASVGWNPYSNANGFDLDTCFASSNGLHGFYVQGSDTNAGNVRSSAAFENRRWGMYDHSFLGNTYTGCNVSTNGEKRSITSITRDSAGTVTVVMQKEHGLVVGQPIRQWNDPDVNFPRNEHTVVAVPDDFTFTYTQGGPATTGLLTIQFLIGGGAYKAYDYNASNVFTGCYSEGDQYPSEISAPSVVTGGLHAASFSDTSTAAIQNSTTFATPNGQNFKDLRQNANPTGVVTNLGGGGAAISITGDREGPAKLVTSLVRSSGVVTVVTSTAHGFGIDQRRYLTANNDPNFSGGLKLIHEVLSSTSFTYLESGSNASGTAGHYFLNGSNTGFTLNDSEPTGYEGWWLWRHANLDSRLFMAWSGNLSDVGPGKIWFPQGMLLGGQGAYQSLLEFSSTEPSGWAAPVQKRGSLRLEAQTYPQAGLVHGIFGYQFIADGIGNGVQILRWPHFGWSNQIDVTNGVGSPFAVDWKKHAGAHFTNIGATAKAYFQLQASNGFPDLRCTELSFFVADSDGMHIIAPGSQSFRIGMDTTATNGYLESTKIGSWLKVRLMGSISAPEYVVTEMHGVWSDGTRVYGSTDQSVVVSTGESPTIFDSGKNYIANGGDVTVNLPTSPPIGTKFSGEVVTANYLKFQAGGSNVIYYGGSAGASGGYLRSNVIGSLTELRWNGTYWFVTRVDVGTWSQDE